MNRIYPKMYPENKNRSEGVLGGFIGDVILRSCNSESQPPSIKRAGFTLIELLVVVLIIGILSSIALPQYERAVEKSRLGALLPNLKTLRDAQSLHWLETGEYEENLENLSVSFPECTQTALSGSTVGTGYACGKYGMRIYAAGSGSSAYSLIEVYTKPSMDDAPLGWRERLQGGKKTDETCLAERNNDVAYSVCKSMGGVCGNTFGGKHCYCTVK